MIAPRAFLLSSALALALFMEAGAAAQPERPIRKEKDQDRNAPTQILPALKTPPAAAAGETSRLVFRLSPLSAKGLLSQQTQDALKALMQNRGAAIIKLRAFVAGTGDPRRVEEIVSQTFTGKKQPLPALSTIQVGALPLEGAQVRIESVSEEKKSVNPDGLAFFSGQRGEDARTSVAQLASAARSIPAEMLRVTCFVGSLNEVAAAREEAGRDFPAAEADFMQPLRASPGSASICEGVGRLSQAAGVKTAGAAVLVHTPRLIFSSAQMAFQGGDADLRLAFERLGKGLEALGAANQDVVMVNYYPLDRAGAAKIEALQSDFFPKAAVTTIVPEGLPSIDATMAAEAIAAPPK